MRLNSPPLEGWQAKPDGVVVVKKYKSKILKHHPALAGTPPEEGNTNQNSGASAEEGNIKQEAGVSVEGGNVKQELGVLSEEEN